MYRVQTRNDVFNADNKLSIIVSIFALIFTIATTNGELYCPKTTSPYNVPELENGWQQWENRFGDKFYINRETQEIRGDDPTTYLAKLPNHTKIEMQYPQNSLFLKIKLLVDNTRKMSKIGYSHHFSVTRSNILKDSFSIFMEEPNVDNLKIDYVVKFEDETNADKEETFVKRFFWLLSSEMSNPQNGFFRYVDEHDHRLEINPNSKDLNYFEFIGLTVAAAIHHEVFVNMEFVKPYYQIMLGQPIHEEGGNADETTSEAVRAKYLTPVQDQMCAFLKGFARLIPLNTLPILTVDELRLAISGESAVDIDVSDWMKYTLYFHCKKESEVAERFWRVVGRLTELERQQLLQSVSGSPRVSIGGFRTLWPKFGIIFDDKRATDGLPGFIQHLNRIVLPKYSSEQEMESKIRAAIKSVDSISPIS